MSRGDPETRRRGDAKREQGAGRHVKARRCEEGAGGCCGGVAPFDIGRCWFDERRPSRLAWGSSGGWGLEVDSYFLIYNERVKLVSGTLANLGAALLGISVGRIILNDADAVGILWLASSLVLLGGAVWFLGFMEREA